MVKRLTQKWRFYFYGTVLLIWASCIQVFAGGSGMNVLVVVNQNSSNSCEVGNYYCERRQVPPENLVRISWSGGNISWTDGQFQTNLLNPLLAAIASRQITNQIDYVVLSMDIPYRTITNSVANGTSSALFYGLKTDSGPNWQGITNSYFGSEQIFSKARPASGPSYSFLTTMVTADSVAQAKNLIDQGVASDGTFPDQPVLLAKSSDVLRNFRYKTFDNAVFNTRISRNCSAQKTNSDSLWGQPNLLGFQTGLAYLSVPTNIFVPGAMADSLTSYGGLIFGQTDQTTLMAFVNGGAVASYGTVTEPGPVAAKFPDPQNYFYQSRGFTVAECYYQSLFQPYEGLLVAEPLAAPFQRAGLGKWLGINSNTVLSGTAQLSVQFSASSRDYPLQQVDLFVDGKFFRTLTNVTPRAGNILTVGLNGYPVTYTVPSNATLASIASGVGAALNTQGVTNITKTMALVKGDRLELHSISTNTLAEPVYVLNNTPPSSQTFYRVVYLPQSSTLFLSAVGLDASGGFKLHLETPASTAAVIQASTNLVNWLPLFTNVNGGSVDFMDSAAATLPRRFYRAVVLPLEVRPTLSVLDKGSAGGFKLHVEPPAATPYTVDASTNLAQWIRLFTNVSGTAQDFQDTTAGNFTRRFYRASVLPQPPPAPPTVVLVSQSSSGSLMQVDGAIKPFTLQVSGNLLQWTPIYTNLTGGRITTTTSASKGSADALSSFLTASRDTLLDSPAQGIRTCSINGTLQVGILLQLSVTKLNGTQVNIVVTNQSASAMLIDLVTNFAAAINANPALQGDDGVVLEDLASGNFDAANFNLRARSPGLAASAIKVRLSSSSANLLLSPGEDLPLQQNLSDLQPRNHLLVTAGATNLSLTFPLDTTTLPDGYHDLTAVAYEGTHVRTQTRIFLPVRIQNSTLSATLTPLDITNSAPVQASYHFKLLANANNVSTIRLFATGGLLSTISNTSNATFTVNAANLGVGLHPFYGIVDTLNAGSYRTDTKWLRFTNAP